MTLSTSDVAVCCSSASFRSRVSRATFVSAPAADEPRRRTAFDAMPRFSVASFRRRVLIEFAACSGAPFHWLRLGSGQGNLAQWN